MMGRVVGKFLRAVFVLLLATGCAKDGGGNDMPVEDGVAGKAGSPTVDPTPTPTCLPGTGCRCENGELGETLCSGDIPSCDCGVCPPFAPATPTAFKACGGAPEGTWQTLSSGLSGVVAHLSVSTLLGTTEITCPADFTELAAADLGLVLNTSGSAEVAYTAPDLYGTVLESCLEAGLARSCEQIPQCEDTGCGTCGCGFANSDFSGAAERWSQQGTTLTVGPFTFDYCVEDRAMTLVNRENGLRFELQRVVEPEQKCAGTAAECGLNETEKDCKLVRGCSAATACVGDAVRTCNYLVDVCTLCPAGCECEFNVGQSQCAGVAHCQDMTTAAECAGLGCEWQGFVGCGGIPDPCDSLTVAECRFTPGCSVK
jgi:hypothetical protein